MWSVVTQGGDDRVGHRVRQAVRALEGLVADVAGVGGVDRGAVGVEARLRHAVVGAPQVVGGPREDRHQQRQHCRDHHRRDRRERLDHSGERAEVHRARDDRRRQERIDAQQRGSRFGPQTRPARSACRSSARCPRRWRSRRGGRCRPAPSSRQLRACIDDSCAGGPEGVVPAVSHTAWFFCGSLRVASTTLRRFLPNARADGSVGRNFFDQGPQVFRGMTPGVNFIVTARTCNYPFRSSWVRMQPGYEFAASAEWKPRRRPLTCASSG